MLWRIRPLTILNTVAASALLAALAYEFVLPIAAAAVNRNEYKQIMYECDHAMRDHFIAKSAVETSPSELRIANLDASELGLLVCHDYDKLRKRLLVLNVSEDMLSQIGLEAIEEKNYQLRKFVEIHEIRY
jgi:hypothetical protein